MGLFEANQDIYSVGCSSLPLSVPFKPQSSNYKWLFPYSLEFLLKMFFRDLSRQQKCLLRIMKLILWIPYLLHIKQEKYRNPSINYWPFFVAGIRCEGTSQSVAHSLIMADIHWRLTVVLPFLWQELLLFSFDREGNGLGLEGEWIQAQGSQWCLLCSQSTDSGSSTPASYTSPDGRVTWLFVMPGQYWLQVGLVYYIHLFLFLYLPQIPSLC